MREYERTLVGVMNAYVGRRMETYFGDLEHGLREEFGLKAPVLSTKSNGGVMTAGEAAERPTETLMSGPAAGAIGAAFVGRAAGFEKLITLDIGGTSTDVSIIDGEPRYSTENQVGNFPVIMPAVDVTSIGAGGGSIAWVDDFGVLKVGPRSAGARPGPACYGLGGQNPTLTDAFVCLGIVAARELAGGKVTIDRGLAEQAVGQLAERLGATLEETAENIIRIATSHIYATLVPLLARKGVDYSDFALFPFGGAGPMHGLLVAREVGIRRVVVPLHPGVLCATGALVADVRRDFVRTIHARFKPGEGESVVTAMREAFADLERAGNAWLDQQNLSYVARRFDRLVDMRFHGQSFEITVPLGARDLEGGDAALCQAFQSEYERVYGYANAGNVLEVRDVRLVAIGETPKPQMEQLHRDGEDTAAEPILLEQPIFHDGQRRPAVFIDRVEIIPGRRFSGPVVIRQYDTTTFVPLGYSVTADRYGNLIAETNDASR
jgi:N-methylhydantoinase A